MSTKVSPTFTNVASGFKCQTRSHFFYYDKFEMAKDLESFFSGKIQSQLLYRLVTYEFPIQMAKKDCRSFATGKIQLKLICNLRTGHFISYKSLNQFWLNFPHPNSKKEFKIFCHFKFRKKCILIKCQKMLTYLLPFLTFVIIKELASEITLYGVVTQQFIQAMQFNTTMHGFSDRILFWL